MEEIRFELDCDVSSQHFHDELEIMYILSGRIAVMMDGSNFALGSEDLVVFNPFEHHEMYREAGNHTLSAFVPMFVLRQAGLGNIRCCSYIQQEHLDYFRVLRTKLAILFKNDKNESDDQRLVGLSQLYGLLAILKQQFEMQKSNGDDLKATPDASRMREVLLYVQQHFFEEISLQKVADQVYLSKGHLSREFQKQMGMAFSDYLRKLRLNMAASLLRFTNRSITDIALECGFANANTMILNFKQKYGETPGVYRKKHPILEQTDRVESDRVSYMGLLKYATYDENIQPFNKKQPDMTRLRIDIRDENGDWRLCNRETIHIGWAKDLLLENMRNAVRCVTKDIGFRYMFFHGLLDDSVDIYHEREECDPYLSFTYMDMIVDFVVSLGVRPWIEFSYTPLKMVNHTTNIFGTSCINLPSDLKKWNFLIEGTMVHFIERYGLEQVQQWRFSPSAALYISYGVFSMEEYLEYYHSTYNSIRKQLPDAVIVGGMLDTGYIVLDGKEKLIQFMKFCADHLCMPDEFCFQCFQCDYSKQYRQETEKKISARGEVQANEPAGISENPNVLKDEIAVVRTILDEHGGTGRPLLIYSWNSTIWQGDLGNDTCFKSAYIVKSFLENADSVDGLCYCYLTDNTERTITNPNVFHGGLGLITYQGIPKAAYYAYVLLNKMDGVLLAKGNGYVITRSKNKKRIQIGLYHYCHYSMDTHIDYTLPEEEQRTYDRYYGFVDSGDKCFRLYLKGLMEGIYSKESYIINRKHGSSYDNWMNMGASMVINQTQQEYLKRISVPGYQYEQVCMDGFGELLISAVLDMHEVRLICIEKK